MSAPYPPVPPAQPAWDAFVRHHPHGHFLQLWRWGDLKAAFGWEVERVAVADASGTLAGVAQLLLRPFPLKLGRMAYLPMGPLSVDAAADSALWKAIHARVTQRRAAFLKWEPGITDALNPADYGFTPSDETIQPPRTILLDIRGDEDTILARMNQGTRRKIRTSSKKGVRCYEATPDDLPRFHALMQTTGARNAFGVHSAAYYTQMYESFVPQGDAALIIAEHEDDESANGEAADTLAAVFVFAVAGTGWYLAGASSNEKRNLMASYGVQWAGIQWAKSRGCHTYDLWGIPDEDEATLESAFQERSEGLWGVYGFKRGWGGEVVRSQGAWDKITDRATYTLYRVGRTLRG